MRSDKGLMFIKKKKKRTVKVLNGVAYIKVGQLNIFQI